MNAENPQSTAAATPPTITPAPHRDWPREAIEIVTALEWAGPFSAAPIRTCPMCHATKEAGHKPTCEIEALLSHADHANKPEHAMSRVGAVRAVGRLVYAWGVTTEELAGAFEEARASFERAADERERGSRPDYYRAADEAAAAAGAGLEDLKDALDVHSIVEAVVHVHEIAELAKKAAAAVEAEALLEPANLDRLRPAAMRAEMAAGYAAEASERLLGMVRDVQPANIDALVERIARVFGELNAKEELEKGGCSQCEWSGK